MHCWKFMIRKLDSPIASYVQQWASSPIPFIVARLVGYGLGRVNKGSRSNHASEIVGLGNIDYSLPLRFG